MRALLTARTRHALREQKVTRILLRRMHETFRSDPPVLRHWLRLGYVATARLRAWAQVDNCSAELAGLEHSIGSVVLLLEDTRAAGAIVGWRVVTGPDKCVAQIMLPNGNILTQESAATDFSKSLTGVMRQFGKLIVPEPP